MTWSRRARMRKAERRVPVGADYTLHAFTGSRTMTVYLSAGGRCHREEEETLWGRGDTVGKRRHRGEEGAPLSFSLVHVYKKTRQDMRIIGRIFV